MSGSKGACLGLLLLSVLVVGLYAPGLRVGYYGDDFWSVFPTAPPCPAYYFLHANPYNPLFYRPLEATFLSHVQSYVPGTTLPIHLTGLALHILVCWVLLLGLERSGLPARAARIAAAFMAVSQAGVSAALGNDTLSQVGSTLFGCVSLFALLARGQAAPPVEAPREGPSRPALLLSLAAFALALLSKETGFFFLPLLLGALLTWPQRAGWPGRRRAAVLWTLPFLAVALLYLWARASVGRPFPGFGSGALELRFGLNVPVNALFLLTVAFLPASSVPLVLAVRSSRLLEAAGLGLTAVGCLALVTWGIAGSPRRRPVAWMLVAAVATVAPACLAERTSEVHLYNAMPFVAALVGVALDRVLDAAGGGGARRRGAAAVLAAILCGEAVAARSKIGMMRRNGERATVLLRRLVSEVSLAPPGACLCVLRSPSPEPQYSVFVVRSGDLLYAGGEQIKLFAGRPDVDLRFRATEAECGGAAGGACRTLHPEPDRPRAHGG